MVYAFVTDEDDGTPDRTLMYYVNDGVYGSFNCILYDHAHCLPVLHKVRVRFNLNATLTHIS